MSHSNFLIYARKLSNDQNIPLLKSSWDFTQETSLLFCADVEPKKPTGDFTLLTGFIEEFHKFSSSDLISLAGNPTKIADQLNGQFLLLVFNKQNDSFIVFNDYLGSFPLYCYKDSAGCIYSNSLAEIIKLKGLDLSLNKVKFTEYLSGAVIKQETTLYQCIHLLTPGSVLTIAEKTSISRYINLLEFPSLELKNSQEIFSQTLKKVIESYYSFSDRTGVELSGGIDSSAVTTFCALPDSERLKTFSIKFPGSPLDEGKYRSALKDKLSFELEEITAQFQTPDFYQNLSKLTKNFSDYPNSSLSWALLANAQKQGVSSLLTGFGGDHLLVQSGFPERPSNLANFLPKTIKRFLKKQFATRQYFPWLKRDIEEEILDLRLNTFKAIDDSALTSEQKQIIYLCYNTETVENLNFAQRHANLFGITRLHPLFDLRLCKIALNSKPEELKNKKLLKNACEHYWPRDLFERQDKIDFSPVYEHALKVSGFSEILKQSFDWASQYLNTDYLRKNLKNPDLSPVIWNLIALEIFLKSATDTP